MEERIKALTRRLQVEYVFYFIIIAAFAAVYELNPSACGIFIGNATSEFILETVSVLLTLATIPLSLKLFNAMLLRHRSLSFELRARYYRMWSATRLISLGIVTVLNLWVYYATLNNIGGFCALICLLTALFCCPTRKRISSELEANEQ